MFSEESPATAAYYFRVHRNITAEYVQGFYGACGIIQQNNTQWQSILFAIDAWNSIQIAKICDVPDQLVHPSELL